MKGTALGKATDRYNRPPFRVVQGLDGTPVGLDKESFQMTLANARLCHCGECFCCNVLAQEHQQPKGKPNEYIRQGEIL